MDTKELLIIIGCSILVVVLSIFFLKRWLKNLEKTKKQTGPSKEPEEGKDREILHKKCNNLVYYSQQDVRFGDLLALDEGRPNHSQYILCPYCEGEIHIDTK